MSTPNGSARHRPARLSACASRSSERVIVQHGSPGLHVSKILAVVMIARAWLRGEAAMSFAHATNQPFFRAVHKLVVSLSARGCHGAALMAATLLLSLERADDPTRLRLLIDALALRARQPKRLLDLDATAVMGGSQRGRQVALREHHLGRAGHARSRIGARGWPLWRDGILICPPVPQLVS